jgi:hypothetical protein
MEVTERSLPQNAYRTLKPGEEYTPVVPAGEIIPEISYYSVLWGIFFSILFSAAAAYLGLKIGQVFEAAIPIAILAVGIAAMTKRKNALSENVIIQSIGAASGVVVAGAIFTIPAIYILHAEGVIENPANFWQIFLSSLFGGFLGILFLIPFRKYFVKEMHGEFPFPEATATTEVLIAGEKGGEQAKVLVSSAIVGGIYDFIVGTFGLWKETFSTSVLPGLSSVAEHLRLEFRLNIGAAVSWLYHWPALCSNYCRRLLPLLVCPDPGYWVCGRRPDHRSGLYGYGTDPQHECRTNFCQLCQACGNRWYCHGRHHRYFKIFQNYCRCL